MNAPITARQFEEISMRFMLMMHATGQGWTKAGIGTWPPLDIKAHIGFMKDLARDLSEAGVLVGAEGLAGPEEAKLVRAQKNGPPITDGPFPETKEFLAGYWMVDVASPQDAYEIAARASAAPGHGGVPMNMPIEVRQVMQAPKVEDL
jgi:hypothetical protein